MAEADGVDTIAIQKTSMECGCVFHNHCIALLVVEQGGDETALPTVPCPNCRQSAVDIRDKHGIPTETTDLNDGISNPDEEGRTVSTISLPSSPEGAALAAASAGEALVDASAAEKSADTVEPLLIPTAEPAPRDLKRPLEIEPFGTSHPMFEERAIRCSYCGLQATKIRVRGKMSKVFKCSTCNTKLVQLHNIFGQWPNDQFKNQSEEAKQEFMRNIADCKSASQVEVKANQMLERFEQHSEYYTEGGQFLPLSVWANQGFDVEAIERHSKPEDKMMHHVLGQCYRVKVLNKGIQGERGHSRRDSWHTADPPPRPQPPPPAENKTPRQFKEEQKKEAALEKAKKAALEKEARAQKAALEKEKKGTCLEGEGREAD